MAYVLFKRQFYSFFIHFFSFYLYMKHLGAEKLALLTLGGGGGGSGFELHWSGPHSLVVRASLRSHVGKPSSADGWSGGFSPGSPVFAHLK